MSDIRAYWRCIVNEHEAEHHRYGSWEEALGQIHRHARECAHDGRWPLSISLHDANGRQFGITYVNAVKR